MGDVLWFNGRWTTTDEPVLGVEDRGLQFGDSVYEVLRFSSGRASFVDRHFRRMRRSLAEIEIPAPWRDFDGFDAQLSELLDRTDFESGIVYVQVTRGETERNHVHPGDLRPNAMMYTRRFVFPDAAKKERGASVITHPDIRWGRCDLKTTNLLPAVLAKQAAQARSAQEAILIRDGRVTEGAAANVFGVRDGRLLTHPLDEKILPGIVREVVLELAKVAGIQVEERPVRSDEIPGLEEAFLSSTTLGVLPVTTIDGRWVAGGKRGALTERLQQLFDEAESREFAGHAPASGRS